MSSSSLLRHVSLQSITRGLARSSSSSSSSLHSTSRRTINTVAVAAPVLSQTMIDDDKYILRTYIRQPIELVRGEGVHVWDANGKKYIDFHSGIAVNSLGHSHPRWVAAIQSQSCSLAHVSNLFFTAPQTRLAELLLDKVGRAKFDKVFYCNSGTEANEAAMKFVRKYQYARWVERVGQATVDNLQKALEGCPVRDQVSLHGKSTILAFSGAFHGRTLGALSITSKWAYRAPFAPLVPKTSLLPFNDLASLEGVDWKAVAGVFLEPIQGEGGVHSCTPAFLHRVAELCRAHDALLVVDEVQCGLSRTGSGCAHQHDYFANVDGSMVQPDIMTMAKPLAGGLPIGAVLMKQRVADAIKPGDHGSTFSGGPLICSAAEVVVDELTKDALLSNVQHRSEQLKAGLAKIQRKLEEMKAEIRIVDVRGLGLLVGLELNVAVSPIIASASNLGVMMISAGDNVIRLCPPLIVEAKHIDEALSTIEQAIMQCEKDRQHVITTKVKESTTQAEKPIVSIAEAKAAGCRRQ